MDAGAKAEDGGTGVEEEVRGSGAEAAGVDQGRKLMC